MALLIYYIFWVPVNIKHKDQTKKRGENRPRSNLGHILLSLSYVVVALIPVNAFPFAFQCTHPPAPFMQQSHQSLISLSHFFYCANNEDLKRQKIRLPC